ncbi:hypothetical protein SAMN04244572_02633 [Azotobacter beijerinckii]|uniref:Uncharacterized protein n=1 Tax=Azotobacter beijerinckii TaxID=170623 RepID=A0A1H6VQD5_9GAMM|nr:hypothetical protein [Azotobacter beijerinckii]SEJ06833.1 hypothetical protein SAMN04244572_02633 [Azotobacter beijerinckii]
MRDGLVRLDRGAGDAEHHDDFQGGQPLDQLAGHPRLAIRDQGTDVACDDAQFRAASGPFQHLIISGSLKNNPGPGGGHDRRPGRDPANKLTAALEELEAAHLAFRALLEASLPKPAAEKKSPRQAHDYEDAPDWATHILEGSPSDEIYVYARWDRDGQCYRGSPHERHTAISSFAMVSDGADWGEEDDCGWQVVSARGQAEPRGERWADQP